jgi:hypothetical protein
MSRLRAIGRLWRGRGAGAPGERIALGSPNMAEVGLFDMSYFDDCTFADDQVDGHFDGSYFDHCYFVNEPDLSARFDLDCFDERCFGE